MDKQFVQQLKHDMKEKAKDLGIDAIGIASPDPFLTLKERLIRHRELGRESGFEPKDIDRRTYPELIMDNPRSIIAIAVAYSSKLENAPRSEQGARRGIMARSAWGEDYHHVLRKRMDALEEWLRLRVPNQRVEKMVDTGELSDRAVAERAGIGWSAKNCSIISPELGSWIYLAEMITNIPFEPDQPLEDQCGECNKCIDACPTGALVGPGELNAQSCVSYLTQTKHALSDFHMQKIGNRLYGCDTCQIVCPVNRGKNWTHHEELKPSPEIAKPLLIPLLEIGNKAFKEKFGYTSAAWRGKKPIQRNAVIALGNFKDETAVPALTKVLLHDPRDVLRSTAAWSLGKIGNEAALQALQHALTKESNEQTLTYIHTAIDKILVKFSIEGD